MGCHFLLQEIFPTQGLNPSLPHRRQMLYHLSHQGSQTTSSNQIKHSVYLYDSLFCQRSFLYYFTFFFSPAYLSILSLELLLLHEVYTCNGIPFSNKKKKNKIRPFAATWLNLEIIILNEARKRKRNIMISI